MNGSSFRNSTLARSDDLAHVMCEIGRGLFPDEQISAAEIKRVRFSFSALLNTAVGELSPELVVDVLARRRGAGADEQTLARDVNALRAVVNILVRQAILSDNPIDPALKLLRASPRERIVTAEEVELLFLGMKKRERAAIADQEDRGYLRAEEQAVAPGRFFDHLEPLVILMLRGGLSRGEALGLCVDDVDFDGSQLWIESSGGKTSKSSWLEMPWVVMTAISDWLDQRIAESEFVFPSPRTGGKIVDLKRPWRELVAFAGIEGLRMSDLQQSAFFLSPGLKLGRLDGNLSNAHHRSVRALREPSRGRRVGFSR